MKPTPAMLIRWSGMAMTAAGIYFAVIQPFHPPDELSSVTTGAWAIIQPLKLTMCLLFLLGITGLYARQVEAAGWPGLVGYLLFSLNWALQRLAAVPMGLALAWLGVALWSERPEHASDLVPGRGGFQIRHTGAR